MHVISASHKGRRRAKVFSRSSLWVQSGAKGTPRMNSSGSREGDRD